MTGFIIPELIVEAIIRDGIANVKANPAIIDNVFGQLLRGYAATKYGASEIARIKAVLATKELAVVYAYSDVEAKSPCFSIMIGADTEAQKRAHLGDAYGDTGEQPLSEDEEDARLRVGELVVTDYDALSGKVTCHAATDLSDVYPGMLYVDADDTEHTILPGISDVSGDKFFFIGKNEDVDFSDFGTIISSINFKSSELKGVTDDINLVIGVHSKDVLLTKYLYILVKYWLVSRKHDGIMRGIYTSSYSGSDFHRDLQYSADHVFVRFLTLTAKVDNTWAAEDVTIIDNIEIDPTPID